MKKIIVAMCLFSLFACQTPQDRISKITYLKDPRTNLCYALSSNSAVVISNVPCTDLVQKAIDQDVGYANTSKPRN